MLPAELRKPFIAEAFVRRPGPNDDGFGVLRQWDGRDGSKIDVHTRAGPSESSILALLIVIKRRERHGPLTVLAVQVIGRVGTLLGDNRINIANFALGRGESAPQAVGLVNVDSEIPKGVLHAIHTLSQVKDAHVVRL